MEILTTEDVTIRFGGLEAVCKMNFNVKKGEIVGIIGPNGAGKTTFFNMLTGIYEPTEGLIKYREYVLNKLKPHKIAELGISRTFQNIRLFNRMTVLENVMLAKHSRTKSNFIDAVFKTKRHNQTEKQVEEDAIKLLEITGIADFRYEYSNSLPYGFQRKLEIARSMATDPEIILLDEPAAGMNENETKELSKFIREVRDMGYTIILIEHDVGLVMEICERIYVLNYGRLIAEGTPNSIKSNPAVVEAYLGKGSV